MNRATDPLRNKELAAIHVAAKELALAEDNYRALVGRFSGGRTESAGGMTGPERRALLDHFRSIGFAAKPRPPARARARRQDERPQARKLRALWLSLWQLGEVHDPREGALAAFLKRHTGLEALQFADVEALNDAIEHLKQWCHRTGWDALPFEAMVPTPQQGSFRPGLIEAQWKRLAALGAFQNGSHARLDTFLRGSGHPVSAPQFLDDLAADAVIAALGLWLRRVAQDKAEAS